MAIYIAQRLAHAFFTFPLKYVVLLDIPNYWLANCVLVHTTLGLQQGTRSRRTA